MPASTMDKDWLCFQPNPSRPRFTPPPGAVDAHCHVFGPGAEFPYAPERKYTPCDASRQQLYRLRDHLADLELCLLPALSWCRALNESRS